MPDLLSSILFWWFRHSLRALLRYFSAYPYLSANGIERSITRIVKEFILYKHKDMYSMEIDTRYLQIEKHTREFVRKEFENKKPLGF